MYFLFLVYNSHMIVISTCMFPKQDNLMVIKNLG